MCETVFDVLQLARGASCMALFMPVKLLIIFGTGGGSPVFYSKLTNALRTFPVQQ